MARAYGALYNENENEAESCFNRALAKAEQNANEVQAANIRANLALVARGRGDLDVGMSYGKTSRR